MNIYASTIVRPYVYICTHKITKHFYIGYRAKNKLPSSTDLPIYKTSSRIVNPLFEEYDYCVVAEFITSDDAYDFEQQLIYENWDNLLLLNQSCYYGQKRFKNIAHSDKTKQKISSSHKGKVRKPFTQCTKQKMSATWNKLKNGNNLHAGDKNPMFGKTHTDEAKQKMSLAKKGKPSHNKGKAMSDETKAKLSILAKARFSLKQIKDDINA
jgi:hypothetical protein